LWGQQRYFVITPDRAMDQAVRQALGRVGVPSTDIFTETIASGDADDGDGVGGVDPSIPRLGLDADANDFLRIFRYAVPDSEQAADAWLAQLPLTVLRIRERPTSPRPADPYPPLATEPRLTPHNEVADGALGSGMQALTGAVCQRWGQACTPRPLVNLQAPPINLQGKDCREIGMNCLGATEDAAYFNAPAGTLDTGEVYALVGTLGTATGNATYVGVSANNLTTLQGLMNVPDTDAASPGTDLMGSASAYAATVPNHAQFYVHYFARNCDAIQGLTDGACTAITPDMVPPGVKAAIAVRSYIAPGTRRGPDAALLLNPSILTFRR
jgi:hypothetical protein